jgi:probable rRNA maturation factor
VSLYNIVDEYNVDFDYSYLDDVLNLAIKKLDVKGYFTIIFVDNEKIHDINKTYRGIDRPTDVISFALNDKKENFEEEINLLGDIYISIPKMKAQALEYGHSEKRELSFLTVHGLLHLLGYDHMTKDEEKVMFSMQEEILEDADIKK